MRRLFWLAALLLSACAAWAEPRVAEPLPRTPGGWVELTPAAVEIDGRLTTAECSNAPGANAAHAASSRSVR